jgi:hypothetical protein
MRLHPALAILCLLALSVAVGAGVEMVRAAAELPCGARPDHERVARLIMLSISAQAVAGVTVAGALLAHWLQRGGAHAARRPQREALARVRARSR